MKTGILRTIPAGLVLLLIAFVAVRLFGHHSPTVDVLGSYFPAWMVCIISGLTLTLVAHWIVQMCQLKPYLGPAPLTAVVGALFCYRQRHLKRLLAFSTISHAGLFLLGIALLTPLGLAGTAMYSPKAAQVNSG